MALRSVWVEGWGTREELGAEKEREREREGGRERKGADAGKKRAREMSREAMERRGDGLCKQTLRRSSAGSRNH